MAASGLRKTGKYRQIPCNMGILRMGVTSSDRKLMFDAILESKMAASGFRNCEIVSNTLHNGCFRNGGDFWRSEIDVRRHFGIQVCRPGCSVYGKAAQTPQCILNELANRSTNKSKSRLEWIGDITSVWVVLLQYSVHAKPNLCSGGMNCVISQSREWECHTDTFTQCIDL